MSSATTNNPLRLTIAQSTELFQLKRTIKDSAEAVESLVKSVKGQHRQLLTEAVVGGSSLARVREIVGPAQFQDWLRKNCSLSAEQAAAFTVVAKSCDELDTKRGFVDALRSLGALE